MDIVREPLDSPAARELIAALDAELTSLYPDPRTRHFRLDADEVGDGRGGFLVAYVDGAPVGCGAVRLLADGDAEIKRMYTVPAARGRGVARGVLAALEVEALGLGARRVVLETGSYSPDAMGLYASAGYERIEPYGEYVLSPTSVCYAKRLLP